MANNAFVEESKRSYGGKVIGKVYHGYTDDNGKWHPSYRYNECDIEFLESRNKGPLDKEGNPITLESITRKIEQLKADWENLAKEKQVDEILDEIAVKAEIEEMENEEIPVT